MAYTPTSPVTGSAQTGLTSPTYTLTADVAPEGSVAKQFAVTTLGGTQTGVTTNTVASPFTLNFVRPRLLKVLQAVVGQTGLIGRVPKNIYQLITRKGVVCLAGQPAQVMLIRTTIEVPAGSDTADAANVRAALSAHIGLLSQQSSGIGDTSVTGVM